MNKKKIILLITLLFLLIGIASASQVSDNTTTNKVVKDTSDKPTMEIEKNNEQVMKKKLIEKEDKNKNLKSNQARRTYNVSDFNTLHNALTSGTYDSVTVNLESDITLTDNTEVNETIQYLTINGNSKTVNGNNTYQFLTIKSGFVSINDIEITNCNSSNGGAIHNYNASICIDHSNLSNNNANYGGAIYGEDGLTTISISTLNNNTVKENGGAIYHYNGYLNVTNSTLSNNNAIRGAAICHEGNQSDSFLDVSYNTFIKNIATSEDPVIMVTEFARLENNTDATSRCYSTIYSNCSAFIWNNTFVDGEGLFDEKYPTLTNVVVVNSTLGNVTLFITVSNQTGEVVRMGEVLIMDDENNTLGQSQINGSVRVPLLTSSTGEVNLHIKYLENNIYLPSSTQIQVTIRPEETINEANVTNYQELVNQIENIKLINCSEYTINLLPGNYNATTNMTWGNSAATKTLKIKGNNITLNGQNMYQFIQIDEGYTLKLENITITNYTPYQSRGLIYIYRGTLILNNSRVNNNNPLHEYDIGGTIDSNYGILTIINSTLNNNIVNLYGGAIKNNQGILTIINSTLNNNIANLDGGAILNEGRLTIINCTLNNNTALQGGAISGLDDMNITLTTLNYNKATLEGGAINNRGNLTITDSNLQYNTVNEVSGGAISNNGNLTITNSNLTGNTATQFDGGAITNRGIIIIKGSNLKHNTATRYGGAIYDNYGNLNITKSILSDNSAISGGAIYHEGDNVTSKIYINNNTFTKNRATTGTQAIMASGFVILENNIINDTTSIYYSTIYSNGTAFITNNIFDDGNESVNDKHPTMTIVEILNSTLGNVTLFITVTNQTGEIVTMGEVLIMDDENNTLGQSQINGSVKVPLSTSTTGEVNLHIKYLENNLYLPSSTQIQVTITPEETINEANVTNYQELVNQIENIKLINCSEYTINLLPGNYNATTKMTWGNTTATKTLKIKGNNITLNGQNRYQFIQIDEGYTLELENITITNYNAYGGVILNRGTLTITNSNLTHNTATFGGVIYNHEGTLNITHSNLTENTAEYGGAISNEDGTVSINNTNINNNNATDAEGGAI